MDNNTAMAVPPDMSDELPTIMDSEETRMREALGLRGNAAGQPVSQAPTLPASPGREHERRRRRFVQDGEVPVVLRSSLREHAADPQAGVNRVEAAGRALQEERAARERAERALAEANLTLQGLRTKLAHAEIAHGEAISAERAAREHAEAALTEARSARASFEGELAEARAALAARPVIAEPAMTQPSAMAQRGPGRPARARTAAAAPVEEKEPEPVKWWLPSYRKSRRR